MLEYEVRRLIYEQKNNNKGAIMKIVVTAYGHDNVIDKIAISSFDESSSGYYRKNENAQTYCDMINALELNGNSWVFAKIVPENTPFPLSFFLPFTFPKVILSLDDKTIQKVFREIDDKVLIKALKGCNNDVLEKVFKNLSSRAGQMLKEDSAYMGPVRGKDVEKSQENILSVIRRLQDTGEIVIALTNGI